MPLRKKRRKTLILVFTILVVLGLLYTQYRAYLNTVTVTHKQLQLNSQRSQILYLDEALAMTARSFYLTRDPQWQAYYAGLQEEFDRSFSEINHQLPENYEGKQELIDAHRALGDIEQTSFRSTQAGDTARARAVLESTGYRRQQYLFSAAIKKLAHRLDEASDNLFDLLRREAIKNILVRTVIGLLLLLGWLWFSRLTGRWQKKLNELNRQRIIEARAAAKELEQVNGQLRELSAYLQDVREKERLFLAEEINEQLGQQIAAMKIRFAEVDRKQTTFDKSGQMELEDIAIQLDRILNQIRSLATEVYPLILRDFGLVEALHWESERVTSHSRAVVMFTSEVEDVTLNHRTSTTLFRSYQQQLQNCVRKGATEISSSLHVENDVLLLRIRDDGRAIHDDEGDLMEDLAIQERLQSIQGQLKTQGTTKEGNLFTISIPYSLQ
jgi:signal transduction histidine kinase